MSAIEEYEPHITARVNTSGMLYVGRKYTGQKAEIYFLKDDKEEKE
jgi:hypothetical protein